MSDADCERWIGLADHAAAGEQLSEREQAWLAQHASICKACGEERQFYSSLRDAFGRPEMLVVHAPVAAQPVRRTSARKPLYIGLALAAGLAVVAVGHLAPRGSHPTNALPAPVMKAQVLLASGETRLGLAPAEAGQQVPQGQRLSTGAGFACMRVANSADVCLHAASTAIFALGDPTQILVYLEKGTLMTRLNHQPAGRKFFVRTSSAEVQAVGTRFSVHLADDGNTRVRLHEGKLAVRAASRVSSELEAPVQASIAQDIQVAPITPSATSEDRLLAELVELVRPESGVSLTISSTPPGADVVLDDFALGKTPLSMFLPAAAHLRLSLPGYEPISEWIACEACGLGPKTSALGGVGNPPGAATSSEVSAPPRIERAFTLTALAASSPELPEQPSHARHTALPISPDRLLAKAQSLRARGQHKACAQLYRRLWSEFPGSEEAKISMISLGELELVNTKNPASALDAFDAYLRLGGPLEREARFGRIRALRALDRHGEAAAETTRFVRDYPASAQAAALRQDPHAK